MQGLNLGVKCLNKQDMPLICIPADYFQIPLRSMLKDPIKAYNR